MNPKDIHHVEEDEYLDKDGRITKDKSQAWDIERRIVYNDGTTEVQKRSVGQDPNTPTTITPGRPDRAIADEWKSKNTNNSAAATQEAISAPSTNKYIYRAGPKDEEHPDGIYRMDNDNYVPPKGETPDKRKPVGVPYKNAQGKYVQKFDDGTFDDVPDSAIPFEKPEEKKPAPERVNPEDPTKRQKFDTATGEWVDAGGVYKAPEKPTLVDIPGGGKGQLVPSGRKDAAGNPIYEAVTVEGTKAPQGDATDFGDLKLEAGQITQKLTDVFAKANATRIRNIAAGMPADTAQKQMVAEVQPIFDLGNARIKEIGDITTTQRGIYADESANFRQKSAAGTSAFSNVMGLVNNTGGPQGRLVPSYGALKGLMEMGLKAQQMFAPEPTMGVGLQQAKQLGINSGVTIDLNTNQIHVGGGGAPGTQPGAAPDIANPLAQGMAAGGTRQQAHAMTMGQVKDDPFFSNVLPDFAASGGMNLTDQLRAPGAGPGTPTADDLMAGSGAY